MHFTFCGCGSHQNQSMILDMSVLGTSLIVNEDTVLIVNTLPGDFSTKQKINDIFEEKMKTLLFNCVFITKEPCKCHQFVSVLMFLVFILCDNIILNVIIHLD